MIDQELLEDTESDIERISQASALGDLADDVLLELIQLEAGLRDPSELVVIPESAKLFRGLADQFGNQTSLWPVAPAAAALLRFSSETAASDGQPLSNDEDLSKWCSWLGDQLSRLLGTSTSTEVLAAVREQFTTIARVTLRAASTAVRPQYALT